MRVYDSTRLGCHAPQNTLIVASRPGREEVEESRKNAADIDYNGPRHSQAD